MKVPLGRKAVAPKLRATTAASKETCLITLETGTISRSGRVLNHSCPEHRPGREKQSERYRKMSTIAVVQDDDYDLRPDLRLN